MARKAKKIPFETSLSVDVVELDSRALVTFAANHPIWKSKAKALADVWKDFGVGLGGAIVRLRPPDDVADGRIEAVKEALAKVNVARIKLEVRRGATLPTEAVAKAKPSRSTAREIVVQLVEEANSVDPKMLADITERVMSEEGL